MKYNIYADNAATTQLDEDAFKAMTPFLLSKYGNASQLYSFSREARIALQNARETIAECINASPDEIVFTSGGSESDNFAIQGMISNVNSDAGIITSEIEHHAVLNTCYEMRNHSNPLVCIPVNKDGIVSKEIFKAKSHEMSYPFLASIMYANNEIGTVQPIEELCEIAHSNDMFFHTDAVQAIGHIDVNVRNTNVDLLSASAHKFNGPKGVGFIYIKKGTPIKPLIYGGVQEKNYRAGTENIASIVGMAVALKNNCKMMHKTMQTITSIENNLINTLKCRNVDFIRNGSSNHIPGNINLSFKGVDGEMLLHRLDLMNIYVSTGSACDSNINKVSHVLKAINCPLEYIQGTIRISFGKNNKPEDGIIIADAISKIIKSTL